MTPCVLGLTYLQHKSLCNERILKQKIFKENEIQNKQLDEVCRYVDCNHPKSQKVCASFCIGSKLVCVILKLIRRLYFITIGYVKSFFYLQTLYLGNNTEQGLWYHTPEKGTKVIIKHLLADSSFTCFINKVNLSVFLHISVPVNPIFPNSVR